MVGLRRMFEIPDGWVARGFVFEVETTSPEQSRQVAQAFGARRYADNWALGQVKANLDARSADPTVPPLAWNFHELRKAWNRPSTRWRPGGAVRPRKPMPRGLPTW
jgi:putative transposase